jgi:hypothetical protein
MSTLRTRGRELCACVPHDACMIVLLLVSLPLLPRVAGLLLFAATTTAATSRMRVRSSHASRVATTVPPCARCERAASALSVGGRPYSSSSATKGYEAGLTAVLTCIREESESGRLSAGLVLA